MFAAHRIAQWRISNTFHRSSVFTYSLLLILLGLFSVNAVSAASVDSKLPDYSVGYDDKRNPFADARAALALAKETNRRVMIKVGGSWCGWCMKMDKLVKDSEEVSQALHNSFVILKVNVSDSNENAEFMKSLPPTQGYPHIFVSQNDGTMLLSKDTAELLNESGKDYSTTQWLSFIEQWKG